MATTVTGAAAGGPARSSTFRSLANRNYRMYFIGQMTSMAGTFMQSVAQGWLVLKLTGSGTALGLVAALQFLPILLFGAMAGVLIDRVDRRRLYVLTQALAGATALTLGVLTATGLVRLWMIYVLAGMLGLITVVDQPIKGAIVFDIVGPEDLTNAVSLNSAMNNMGRIVGPALAGIIIGGFGLAACFLVNAASYVAVIAALCLMRPEEMHQTPPQPRTRRQVREGLKVVRESPELLALLVLGAIFFGMCWLSDIVFPLMARFSFHGGAGLYGLFLSVLSLGSIIGALGTARRVEPDRKLLVGAGICLGVVIILAASAPTIPLELVALVAMGIAGASFITTMSARIQLQTPIEVRGRVMALWMIAAMGTRPFGAPIVGAVGEHFGARYAMGMGGVVVLVVALPTWWFLASRGERRDLARRAPTNRALAFRGPAV